MLNEHESMEFQFEPIQDTPKQDFYQEPQKPAEPARRKKKGHVTLKIVSLALACAILGGFGGGALVAATMSPQAQDSTVNTMNNTNLPEDSTAKLSNIVHTNSNGKNLTPSEVYNQNVNAVVGISTEATTTNVFGQVSSSTCSGSGFIITPDGYVVTNNHVVKDATKVTVSMYDGTKYDATIVGTEPSNDVALLKIDAANLPAVSIGSSSSVGVGDQVVAIGNPLGELTFTLTVGYVSALDREINTDGTPINMLQTDVSINSGNSGGPLFDMAGNVIGITTAKYSSSGYGTASIEGIGFAIPVDDVMRIVDDLKQYGYVTGKPQLGVTVRDFDTTTAATYGLPEGVYVDSVVEGGSAARAGMQQGDIITAINDKQVKNYTELAVVMKQLRAGDDVRITVFRSGQTLELKTTLDEKLPQSEEEAEQSSAQQQPQQQAPEATNPSGGADPFYDIFGRIFGNAG